MGEVTGSSPVQTTNLFMKWFNFGGLILAIVWTAFLALGFKSVPPLGALLSVNQGVWAHKPVVLGDRRIEGLKNPVTVTFDGAGVPHFFAANEADLLMAQGFVMASQRLFQMDLITRVTDGRLSEWFGDKSVKSDEFFVRFGMRESARETLETFNSDPETANLLSAFASGVNAYIGSLEQLPPEYIIIGQKPEPWSVMRIIHMGKQLTFGLAGRSFDHYLSRIQQSLGAAKVLDLFPEFSELDDFIYPSPHPVVRRRERPEDFPFVSRLSKVPFFPLPAAGNGSNNWAVSAKKSTTGMSIMANDTHLGHTLPNVWYEAQLSTPEFNIYGVGLVAIPGLVNGFNSKISWGPTNGTLDVLDYFEVEFESDSSNKYRFGEEWLEAEVQEEDIRLVNGPTRELDVVWTRFGAILHREGKLGLAVKWRGHSTQHELKAIHNLYSSKNITECLASFAVWSVPVQNFICADQKDVAIQPAGYLPKRQIGEGRFIMAGDAKAGLLENPIPERERPRLIRPANGMVLSANARMTDEKYPHYMGWDFEEPFRARMIRRRLLEKDKLSPEDFIKIQNDTFDPIAELVLPLMLEALGNYQFQEPHIEALIELRKWNYLDLSSARAPAIFKEWFEQLKIALFEDEYKVQGSGFFPKDPRVIELLRRVSKNPADSDAQWVDNKGTKAVETLNDVVVSSFFMAWIRLTDQQGADFRQWTFRKWARTRFPHVARLPGFGVFDIPMDGGNDSIRGNQGNHGAVYKIVVAHGEWPKAWIQVPGGNEGDPFTREYQRHLYEWAEGKMRPAEFYHDVSEAKDKAQRVVVFSP